MSNTKNINADRVNELWEKIRKEYINKISEKLTQRKENIVRTERGIKEKALSLILDNYLMLFTFGGVIFAGAIIMRMFDRSGRSTLLLWALLICGFILMLISAICFIKMVYSQDMEPINKERNSFREKTWIEICDHVLEEDRNDHRTKDSYSKQRLYIDLLIYHRPRASNMIAYFIAKGVFILYGIYNSLQPDTSHAMEVIVVFIVTYLMDLITGTLCDGWKKDFYYDEFIKALGKKCGA